MDEKRALSTQDVADMLHVSKSMIYELIRQGEITSYKVGRKVRFMESDVKKFIAQSREKQAKAGAARAAAQGDGSGRSGAALQEGHRGFVICGQDLILDVLSSYLAGAGIPALRSYTGSYDSLIALYKGQVDVASAHLWDGTADQYNIPYVRALLPGMRTVIVRFVSRWQGLYVQQGNPKNIKGWEDLQREDIRMVNREYGAGSRVLLDEHLKQLGIYGSSIAGYRRMVPTHLAVASAVGRGEADVGVGTEKIAHQVEHVEFIPLQQERYDLVLRREDMERPEIAALLRIVRMDAFQQEFSSVGGYGIDGMGAIVAEL